MKWIWILSLNNHPLHAYTHKVSAMRECGRRNKAEVKRINDLQKRLSSEDFTKALGKRSYFAVTKVPVS